MRFRFTGQSFPIMQEDKPVDLSKILSKCVTEDGIDDANEQPLYILICAPRYFIVEWFA